LASPDWSQVCSACAVRAGPLHKAADGVSCPGPTFVSGAVSMRATVVGCGAVGSRAVRQLASTAEMEAVAVIDRDQARAEAVVNAVGPKTRVASWSPTLLNPGDVVVLALPGGHREMAEAALERQAHVVSVSDAESEVRALLDLGTEARERGLHVVLGAGFAPGLSCVLVRHGATLFDVVTEIHVAKAGTGGPACARQHHNALSGGSIDWRDGAWLRRSGGSGRELCWFPEPVAAQDCYRAHLPDALLLAPAFPSVVRVTARVAASRRDRLSSWLPMLRPPHPEGLIGALRVELRGRQGPAHEVAVLGAIDRPAVAAGAVAAVSAAWAGSGRLGRVGAGGLALLLTDPVPFLHELAGRGVRAAVFEGISPGRPAVPSGRPAA